MSSYFEDLNSSADFIKAQIPKAPVLGIVLGSGLGMLADKIQDKIEIPYEKIPGFPVSTVAGHSGKLIFGYLGGKYIACMAGRFHYYEGYDIQKVLTGVRMFKLVGAEGVIITNAAGGVNTAFKEGAIMLINDHIGFLAPSALRGVNIEQLGDRFFDMTCAYDKEYLKIAKDTARTIGLNIEEGVYMFFPGPNYETPAEIRAARILGADAVGMSTVPEVTACAHMGLRVLGISVITNMAAGILDKTLNHDEVMQTAETIKSDFVKYVENIVREL